ncbi:MAG: nucleoside 2-deoxyribosyltransferase domain-containing protein [Acidobacteriota bacterium]|nr:nucleoside 2-deoxyribosyltransferase domain-containing protein [Acidobacteriota bacterium]
MQKVYLAGGMKSEWREKIKRECKEFTFFCPKDKEVSYAMIIEEYGTWDLHYIKQADIIFCYMEKTNPSGIGLACEMGFAYGIGKTVILVLETENEHIEERYLDFLRKVSHVTFSNFLDGIKYLKSFYLKPN